MIFTLVAVAVAFGGGMLGSAATKSFKNQSEGKDVLKPNSMLMDRLQSGKSALKIGWSEKHEGLFYLSRTFDERTLYLSPADIPMMVDRLKGLRLERFGRLKDRYRMMHDELLHEADALAADSEVELLDDSLEADFKLLEAKVASEQAKHGN